MRCYENVFHHGRQIEFACVGLLLDRVTIFPLCVLSAVFSSADFQSRGPISLDRRRDSRVSSVFFLPGAVRKIARESPRVNEPRRSGQGSAARRRAA